MLLPFHLLLQPGSLRPKKQENMLLEPKLLDPPPSGHMQILTTAEEDELEALGVRQSSHTPSAATKSEALRDLAALLDCLDQQLAAGSNYEFCQALLQLVLQVCTAAAGSIYSKLGICVCVCVCVQEILSMYVCVLQEILACACVCACVRVRARESCTWVAH